MQELPVIAYVGDAADVILGCIACGWDLDGTEMPGEFEYMDDDIAAGSGAV